MKICQSILIATLFACRAHASVTNIAWYRLGENDPGATSGVTATNTANLLGFNPLKPIGNPRYTNAVSPGAANGLGSTLAVHFSGTNQCFTNALVSIATDNFGVEAWVRPNTTNGGSYFIAQNGIIGLGAWDIRQGGGSYFGVLAPTNGASSLGDGTAIASPGVWAHVAMVRNNGTNRFYFNGTPNGPATTNAPGPPVGHFTIGGNFGSNVLGLLNNSFFNGTIDEVRVFTFVPGQFSTNDLLFHALRAVTLPATDIDPPNATLNGRAHPVGFPTSVWIEWGTTTNYGNVTPVCALSANGGTTNLSEMINSAFGGFTYHFRVVASNSLEVVYGADQNFTIPLFTLATNLTPVLAGSVAWGDFDNDGRLDILLTGDEEQGVFQHTELWRNTGSSFTNFALIPPGVADSSVAWGDCDNDGKLDILITGQASDPGFHKIARVLNLGSTFGGFDLPPGVFESSVAWGDYDNDGRLDILLTGATDSLGSISQIWRNTGNGFTTNNAGLPGVAFGSSAWGDYDNDGRLDILLTGGGISQLWRNTGNGFTNINAGLPAASGGSGSVAWGDYDNDGRLDILIAGQVWRNTANGFTNINAGLPGVSGPVAWGDYDNDGRLDILLSGPSGNKISQVWRNTGSGFTNINAGLPGVSASSSAWGDYDNDGRLDILLTGSSTNGNISRVWRNNTPLTNTPPTAPTGLSVSNALGGTMIFRWNASSDTQTPASGLSYNVRIGTTPGGGEIVSPMAASTGLRCLPQLGNAQMVTFRLIHNPPLGQPIYWSVQAVDTSFAGGPFALEQSFTLNTVFTPTNGIPVPGDLNGDGIMSQSELAAALTNLNGNGILTDANLNLVLSNYFATSPFLYMTNVAGLGGTNVTFALSNSFAGAFSVEFTTNLVDWYLLGPATPRYLFTDTNAPAEPQRYYRLRWP